MDDVCSFLSLPSLEPDGRYHSLRGACHSFNGLCHSLRGSIHSQRGLCHSENTLGLYSLCSTLLSTTFSILSDDCLAQSLGSSSSFSRSSTGTFLMFAFVNCFYHIQVLVHLLIRHFSDHDDKESVVFRWNDLDDHSLTSALPYFDYLNSLNLLYVDVNKMTICSNVMTNFFPKLHYWIYRAKILCHLLM